MSDTSRMDMVTIDLSKPLQRENCGALLATGDENANRFGAHIVRGGASVDLTGCTVSGSFIRADGVTVPLEGAAEGNTAHVDLTAQCYAVDGVFSLAIKISGEDYAHTIRMVDGYIRRTDTGKYVDSDNTVYSAEDLMAVLKELDGMENPGSADTMLEGTEMIGADGKKVTGTIPVRSSSDMTAEGSGVSIKQGYYPMGYFASVGISTMRKPTISVDDQGIITASVNYPTGYVTGGNLSQLKYLSTKSASTITPTTETQTAVAKGLYTTGDVVVAGDANLVPENIKSGVTIFGVTGSYEG